MSRASDPRKMMGFEAPGDGEVRIPIRNLNAMKLALWRSRTGWEIVMRAANEVFDRCRHLEGCPGKDDEGQPCVPNQYDVSEDKTTSTLISEGCPDREQRASALVILNAARMFAPLDIRRSDADAYFAPSREYFSEVIAELGALQLEVEAYRSAGYVVASPANQDQMIAPNQLSAVKELT